MMGGEGGFQVVPLGVAVFPDFLGGVLHGLDRAGRGPNRFSLAARGVRIGLSMGEGGAKSGHWQAGFQGGLSRVRAWESCFI